MSSSTTSQSFATFLNHEHAGLLKDGAVIATAVRETPGKMQVKATATPRISFGEIKLWHLGGAAGMMRDLVDFVDNNVIIPIGGSI